MQDWTYSGDPASSDKDEVRFLSGDTSTGNQLVTDSEIAWALTEESSNTYRAAALVCESIASIKSQDADMSVGDLKISASQLSERFAAKAKDLRRRATARGVSMYVGGRTISRKDTVEADTDRVKPFFARDDFVNPSADSGASTERT
jgi:hypothetical protein